MLIDYPLSEAWMAQVVSTFKKNAIVLSLCKLVLSRVLAARRSAFYQMVANVSPSGGRPERVAQVIANHITSQTLRICYIAETIQVPLTGNEEERPKPDRTEEQLNDFPAAVFAAHGASLETFVARDAPSSALSDFRMLSQFCTE
eukprot:Polyplicarium_translucidae@DN1031_c0_g1_i1.p1